MQVDIAQRSAAVSEAAARGEYDLFALFLAAQSMKKTACCGDSDSYGRHFPTGASGE